MPTVAGFATDLRAASRRLVRTVPAVLDASFHPFRTVREGTRLVQGLLAPEQGGAVPPPTEAAAPADTPDLRDPRTTRDLGGRTEPTAEPGPAPGPAPAPAPAAGQAPEPAPDADPERDLVDDRPIQSRGPAPHVPPAIAAEVERDYGDEIPGITAGE